MKGDAAAINAVARRLEDQDWDVRRAVVPALAGRAPETSESVGWQNFGKMLLVFGCIGSDFCKKICVLQHARTHKAK